jgi:hypothetical protein
MTIKLIHTSDWQIGKVFRFVDNATMGLLQDARLGAITHLGELARAHGLAVLVIKRLGMIRHLIERPAGW